MKNHLIILLLTFAVNGISQEALCPLGGNLSYHYPDLQGQPKTPAVSSTLKKSAASLQLPFLDDFTYATRSNYPDQRFWKDSLVYVNNGYAIAPPSYGVATFDGLNRYGYPYDASLANFNLSLKADTLTSQPINLQVHSATSKTLQPSDSVALVFFYQRRGFGDPPETSDSLIVDLFRPLDNRWDTQVWTIAGSSSQAIDTTFRKAFVRIDSAAYFQDGFMFRFRNKATVAGNFDHWHVDYVMVNTNLTRGNTNYFDDITFSHVPSPLLRDYAAMPWHQFQASDMATTMSVRIRNNNPPSNNPVNTSYEYQVTDKNGGIVYHYPGGPSNLHSFDSSGYSNVAAHRTPPVISAFTLPAMPDSSDFLVKHFLYRSGITQGNDFIPMNDTIVQWQRFRNYYAYDDGSAESGYYVNGQGSRLAIRVRLFKPDTLRAVRIYFDPSASVLALQGYQFRLNVWSDNGGAPGTLVYFDSLMNPFFHKKSFKGVPEFKLTSPKQLPEGNYFIGIQQRIAVNAPTGIVIGFDRNYDFHQHMYFNSGSGWEQSTIPGSLMIRPVFGSYVPPPAATGEHVADDLFAAFPNPASERLTIRKNKASASQYKLYNITGSLIAEGQSEDPTHEVDVSDVPEGIYFLLLSHDGKTASRRIVIQR